MIVKAVSLGFIVLAVFVLQVQPVGADIIHESATMGASGQTGGWGIDSSIFMGYPCILCFVLCFFFQQLQRTLSPDDQRKNLMGKDHCIP